MPQQASESAATYRRTLQQRVNDPLVPLFGRAAEGSDRAGLGSPGQKSFLQDPKGLPPSVHLLTLKDNGDGKVLLRLAHLYQVIQSPLCLALTSIMTVSGRTQEGLLAAYFCMRATFRVLSQPWKQPCCAFSQT